MEASMDFVGVSKLVQERYESRNGRDVVVEADGAVTVVVDGDGSQMVGGEDQSGGRIFAGWVKDLARELPATDVSSAAAALGRKGGQAGKGASKVRGDSEHYKAIRAKARYYGVAELPAGSRLAAADSISVQAFPSREERDAWVARSGWVGASQYLQTSGEQRRAVTRSVALSLLREIMPGADGYALRVCGLVSPFDDEGALDPSTGQACRR
jgi:hypothetical protein